MRINQRDTRSFQAQLPKARFDILIGIRVCKYFFSDCIQILKGDLAALSALTETVRLHRCGGVKKLKAIQRGEESDGGTKELNV